MPPVIGLLLYSTGVLLHFLGAWIGLSERTKGLIVISLGAVSVFLGCITLNETLIVGIATALIFNTLLFYLSRDIRLVIRTAISNP